MGWECLWRGQFVRATVGEKKGKSSLPTLDTVGEATNRFNVQSSYSFNTPKCSANTYLIYDTLEQMSWENRTQETKRRKMKSFHPDSYMNDETNKSLSGFEELPDEVMFHIMSFHASPTLKGVARLCRTLGRVSKIFRKRVIGFVQTTPIHCCIPWKQKPYRTIAWLCLHRVRIGTLDASWDQWNYLDAGLLLYMLEQCDLIGLDEVTLDFRHFNVIPPRYECFLAADSGISGEVVDNIMDQEVRFRESYKIYLQRAFLQVIGDRATNCFEVNITGAVTAAGSLCDFGFLTCQLSKLPLQKLHMQLFPVYGPPISQNDFEMLSKAIESYSTLERLSLHIPGDCQIRSKSIRRLDYGGDNELIECECPLLERMRLVVNKPGTAQLLLKFSHCIKKFCIFYRNNLESPQRSDRLTEIIRSMPLLEEFRLEYPLFGTERCNGCLDIKSDSLRRINLESCNRLFHLSCCICPNLEMIECNCDETMTAFPLIPLDSRKFRDLVSVWNTDRRKKVSILFRDCPFARCEIPDSCLIKLRRYHAF